MPRFHLSFDYEGGHKTRSHGSQVIICDTFDEAVAQIARERGLKSIRIRKRFFYGKPASEAEVIDREFRFDA